MQNKIDISKCDFLMNDGCCAVADVATFMSLPDEKFKTIPFIKCLKNPNCYYKQFKREDILNINILEALGVPRALIRTREEINTIMEQRLKEVNDGNPKNKN